MGSHGGGLAGERACGIVDGVLRVEDVPFGGIGLERGGGVEDGGVGVRWWGGPWGREVLFGGLLERVRAGQVAEL